MSQHDDDSRNETSGPSPRDKMGEQRNGAIVLVVMGVLLVGAVLLGMFVR